MYKVFIGDSLYAEFASLSRGIIFSLDLSKDFVGVRLTDKAGFTLYNFVKGEIA